MMKLTMLASTALIATMMFAGAASAETAVATADQVAAGTATLGEVIVTAQKSSQNIQKVSQSVVAIKGDKLIAEGVHNAEDLANIVPGIEIKQGTTPSVFIRGIGTSNGSVTGDQGVAEHIDGVFQTRATAFTAGFFDIDRVEVLKGPQGTLYGRGSIGGSINVISKAPSQTFGGNASAEYGNYNLIRLGGALNVPIDEKTDTAVRVAFQTEAHDGYASNGADDENSHAIRLRAHTKPIEPFTVDLSTFYYDNNDVGLAYYPLRDYPGAPADVKDWKSFINTSTNNQHNDLKIKEVTVEANWNFGFANLTYQPAYAVIDDNGTLLPLSATGAVTPSARTLHSATTTHEVRLASNGDTRLKWVVGYYHLYEKNAYSVNANTTFGYLGTASTGVFGQGTFSITDKLRIIGGVRKTDEQKDQYANGKFHFSNAWHPINYRASIEYDFLPQSMAYFTESTGFKAGGFFTSNPPNYFNPETVTQSELGVKNRFLDSRLEVNVAGYLSDYQGYQVAVTIPAAFPGATTQGVFNGGNAQIYGAEAEVDYQFTPKDRIDTSFSYNHGVFKTITVVGTLAKVGDQLPQAPLYSGNIAYTHDFDVPKGGTVAARVETHFEDKSYISLNHTPFTLQNAYTKSGVSLTYTPQSGAYSLAGWVRNLENTAVRGFINETVGGETVTLSPPRTLGLTLSAKF